MDQALDLGLDAIAERAVGLGARLREGLDEIHGVTTHDLGTDRCAIVTAAVAGVAADQVMRRLAELGINVSVTVPEYNQFDTSLRGIHPLVRFSPRYYNTDDELARTLQRVAQLVR